MPHAFDGATGEEADMSEPSVTPEDSAKPRKIGLVLFEQFETLDVFGPVQMLGRLADYGLFAISENGSSIRSSQGLPAGVHYSFATAPQMDGMLVPGGQGTRREVGKRGVLPTQSTRRDWVQPRPRGAAIRRHADARYALASLSWVRVSKSPASCRSWSCSDGSPTTRLTMRPRFTAGREKSCSAQRTTFL